MPKQKTLRKRRTGDGIRRLLLSWLLAVTLEYLLLPGAQRDLAGLARMSIPRVIAATGGWMIFLFGIAPIVNTAGAERWAMAGGFAILASAALGASFTWTFLAVCLLILLCLIRFGIQGWNSQPEPDFQPKKEGKIWLWITGGLSIAFFLFVSAWTVGRVMSFSTPTFDFGIFCQMFYNMRKSGLPITTVERDGALSHFAVHVSPIYYLLLPFYALVPGPATLQVLQAAVITSAVIPLWKLGKRHGLSGSQGMLVCGMLLLYPAFSGGTGYDLHENCFLTPLILWLFWGIEKRNRAVTWAFALLTLTVKEDAAVYVAVIALWLIVKTALRFRKTDGGDLVAGIAMLAFSLGWFFLVTGYLAKSGDGVMTWRYSNFLYDGTSSLLTVIISVILNPMKAVYECVDPEKLPFIALTLLPLLGLPLLTRRYERYILLIPYILVNLMPDYQYQHDIFFQYTFGSTAFLMYLAVVNLAEIRVDWHRTAVLSAAAALSLVCFCKAVVPRAIQYPVQAVRYYDYYQNIRDTLSIIPEDASVTASTFCTTYLSQREILYDVRYSSPEHLLETQYVVLQASSAGDYQQYAQGGEDNGFENLVRLLEDNGYRQCGSYENVQLFQRKD